MNNLFYDSSPSGSKSTFGTSLVLKINEIFKEFNQSAVEGENNLSINFEIHTQLVGVLKEFESRHTNGKLKSPELPKHLKMLLSALFEAFQKRSSKDCIFITEITLKLMEFRSSLIRLRDSDSKECISLLDELVLLASHFMGTDTENFQIMASLGEVSCEEQLVSVSDNLRKVAVNIMPSTNIYNDMLNKPWLLTFFLRCMVLRLFIDRELNFRNAQSASFEKTVEQVLEANIFDIFPRFREPATLKTSDAEYVTNAVRFLRDFDARRRVDETNLALSAPVFVRTLPAPVFIRLRSDIFKTVVPHKKIPSDAIVHLVFETEIHFLKIYSKLVLIDSAYLSSLVRTLVQITNPKTARDICLALSDLTSAIDGADIADPKNLVEIFLDQYFDRIVAPLRSSSAQSQIEALGLFSEFSRHLPVQFKRMRNKALIRGFPLNQYFFAESTTEDILNLQLHDWADLEPPLPHRLAVVCTFLHFKSFTIARKAASMLRESAILDHLTHISAMSRVINDFACFYASLGNEDQIDNILGFFTVVLRGIAQGLSTNVRFSYSANAIVEFLKLVLHSERLHACADVVLGHHGDIAIPFRFGEALSPLRLILRNSASKKRFFDALQEAEKNFAMTSTAVPRLYSLVCSGISSTMFQVVLANVRTPVQQLTASCRFVEEAVLHVQQSSFGKEAIHFVPTVLSLHIAQQACDSAYAIAQVSSFELPADVSAIVKLGKQLQPEEFKQACGPHVKLKTLLNSLSESINNYVFDIQLAIMAADQSIESLFSVVSNRSDGSVRDRLRHSPARRSVLDTLSQHLATVKIVWEMYEIETLKRVKQADVAAAVTLFSEIRAEWDEWKIVDEWLRSKGFVPSSIVSEVMSGDDLSIQEIVSKTDEFVTSWALSSESARTLRFFVGQRCNLFDTNFSKYLESHDERASIQHLDRTQRNEVISTLTGKAVRALENIIRDEELPLSSLAQGDIRGMMKALKGGRNDSILSELNIVAKFFQSLVDQQSVHFTTGRSSRRTQASVATIDRDVLAERMERLAAAVELLQLSDILPGAVEFLKTTHSPLQLGKSNPTVQRLDALSVKIMDHDNIRLGQVRELLHQVNIQLHGLHSYHLQLIASLTGGYELFLFMQSEPDIIGQIGILTQEMQGNPVHQAIINDLSLVHGFLVRVFPSLISRAADRWLALAELADALCSELSTARTASEMQKALQSCVNHVAEITTWFGGALGGVNANKIVANVLRFQREGRYVARTPCCPGGAGLDLVYGDKDFRVTDARLQEQVRAAVFVCGDDGSVNTNGLNETQRSALRNFISSHEEACKIVSMLAHAEALGHPSYQSCEKSLGEYLSTESLSDFLGLVKEECSAWDVSMEDAFDSSRRFALLTRTQILQVLTAVKESDTSALASLLRLCFPDTTTDYVDDLDGSGDPFNIQITTRIVALVAEIWDKLPPLRSVHATPSDLLIRARSVLDLLEQALDRAQILAQLLGDTIPLNVLESRPKVLHAVGMMDELLMRSIEASIGTVPMSSQLMLCENNTTKNEIGRFLRAVRKLAHVPFILLGVNNLAVDSREYLLNQLTAAPLEGEADSAYGDRLLLVFTGKNGLDAFSLFPVETVDVSDGLTNTLIGFKRMGATSKSNISVVTGAAGAGKSRFVQNHFLMNGIDQTMTLTVHEDFSPDMFISWYRQQRQEQQLLGRPQCIGVHVNITPYGRLDRLARFLYSWFAFGLLEDEISGRVAAMARGVQHIVFIELPALTADSSVPTTPTDAKNHPYVEQISTLGILANSWEVINSTVFPFIVDSDARLAAYYLDLYWAKTLTVRFQNLPPNLPTSVTAVEFSDEKCRHIFDRLFDENETDLPETCASVGSLQLHRSACIKLLAERVKFLPCLQRKVAEQLDADFGDNMTADVVQNRKNHNITRGYFAFLMSLFVRESATLTDNSLRQNWSNIATPFTARYICASDIETKIYILCMSAETETEKDNLSKFSSMAVSGSEVRSSPGQLRLHFAPSFGISDSSQLLSILKAQSYVMTPDFAVKMLVLFEKRKIKASTILQGETGTGKTELLMMLSLLSNANSQLIPDLAFKLREVLQSIVESPGNILTHTEASHRVLFDKNADGSPKTRAITVPAMDGQPAQTKEVGELWSTATDPQKLLNGILQVLEEENDELVAQLVPIFLREFRRLLRQFPLLRRSPWVKSVLFRDLQARRQMRTGGDAYDDDSDEEDETADGEEGLAAEPVARADARDAAARLRRGISTARELIDFIRDVVTATPKNLFHCIRMHEGINADEFRRSVRTIVEQAEEAMEISSQLGIPIELVAFIDELNTTSIMGMVKEVFMDHTLDGIPLPTNIFWVAAINPSSKTSDLDPVLSAAGTDTTTTSTSPTPSPRSDRYGAANYTGVKSDSQDLRYIVNELPNSLGAVVMEYSSLSTEQERDWIESYLNDTNLGLATELQSDENRDYIISALRVGIVASQQFVRMARMERVEVSIRDMVRAVTLYRFLLRPEIRETFLPTVQGEQTRELQTIDRERCWKALMVALGLVYYFRLDTSRDLRSEYMVMLMRIYEQDGLDGRGCVDAHSELSSSMPFEMVLTHSIDKLWYHTSRPRGIAPTRGLKENLFATVVCMEACIPLIITGPPGTGKTLSFQIASRNMKGISAPKDAYKRLKLVQPFTYQCSQQSTAAEIQDVFEAAIARLQRFIRAGITSERCVVFMDEVGLPPERRAALKSIHYYTDHAQVASVMLTNQTLDAAKTNRAVQLLQSQTTTDDLVTLALGSLFDYDVTDDSTRTDRDTGPPADVKDQVLGLCEAYREAKCFCDIPGHPDAYHLRDFIYLCRFIRHCESQSVRATRAGHYLRFSAATLIHALRRTFNGVSDANFRSMAFQFLSRTDLLDDASNLITTSLSSRAAIGGDGDGRSLNSILGSEVMSSLRNALKDELQPGEDPNQSHFRHIMLIDNSSSENAIALLYDLNVLDKQSTEVFQVSDFPDDTSDLNRSALISRIKSAVELGKTIVLANSHSIISAFFDLVNKHYVPVGARSKAFAPAGEDAAIGIASDAAIGIATEGQGEETTDLYYANISMGSFSRPCVVHPKTKIIVHIPISQLPFTPLPFLNRFDKFRISVEDVLEETLEQVAKSEMEKQRNVSNPQCDYYPLSQLYRHIHDGVIDFVRTFNGKTMMYGLVERETVAALILRSIQDTQLTNNLTAGATVPVIRRPFHVSLQSHQGRYEDYFATSDENGVLGELEDIGGDHQDRLRTKMVFRNIRKYVREVNFQLLQYARPEHMFLARGVLPAAYTQEYLRQEHFSASNLIRFLVRSHWERPLSLEPLNSGDAWGHKFIIFVRTSADLYRLKQSTALQRELLPGGDSDSRSIRVIHLGSYTSSSKCMSDIARYVEAESYQVDNLHRRLLIVVADRAIVSTSQVNATIRTIDQMLGLYQSKESLPLIVVVQHFPSESLQFGSLYDSLPFNGWDMQYCDAFQLDAPTDDDTHSHSEAAYPQLETGHSRALGGRRSDSDERKEGEGHAGRASLGGASKRGGGQHVNDPRRWLRVAFGLETAPDVNDAVSEFQHVFLDELKIALNSTSGPREDAMLWKNLQLRGIHQSLPLYANKPDKVASVLAVLRERPFITSSLLRRFTAAWSTELSATVREAAEELITGRSLESLLKKIKTSFQILLRAFGRYSILAMCTNYGFESIARLPTDSELTFAGIDTAISGQYREVSVKSQIVCVLNLMEGLKMPAADELRRLGTAGCTILGSAYKYPPCIPMYGELLAQVRRLQEAAVQSIARDEESVDDTIMRMRELLPRQKSLHLAIESIETSAKLWGDLIHDKICCSCGFDGLLPHELASLTAFIAASFDYKPDLLRLLVSDHALQVAIRVVNTLQPVRGLLATNVSPMQFLAPLNLEWPIKFICKPTRHTGRFRSGDGRTTDFESRDLGEEVAADRNDRDSGFESRGGPLDRDNGDNGAVDIEGLFAGLQQNIVTDLWGRGFEALSSDSSVVQKWIEAISELCSKLGSFCSTAEKVQFGDIGAVRCTIFKFILHALSAGCTVAGIRGAVADFFRTDVADGRFKDSIFTDLVAKLHQISSTAHEQDRAAALSMQTEELVRWFVGQRFIDNFRPAIETILVGLGSDAPDSASTLPFKTVPLLVQIQWLLHMLDSQVMGGYVLRINSELERRGARAEWFLPTKVESAIAYIRSQRDGGVVAVDGGNAAVGGNPVNTTLSALVFQACLEQYRASRMSFNVSDLLLLIESDRHLRPGGSVVNALKASALAVHIVEIAATQWAEGGHMQASIDAMSDRLLTVFDFMDGLKEYFLMCLRSESCMTRFLSHRDRLDRYRLDDSWYVPTDHGDDGAIVSMSKDEIRGRMPFMVIETHEHFATYAALSLIVCSDDIVAPTQLRAWAQSQVGQGRIFLARMMIFLASYHECFLKGRASGCVTQYLASVENMALLNITPIEVLAYRQIAEGPSAEVRTADDGLSYLFSAASMRERDEWMISRRVCAVNAMALLLGSPPDRCYYYTVCFDIRIRQSLGLGSGYGLYPKDCGYQTELDSFMDKGTQQLPVFRSVRRYRALNNYLIWAAYAWGQWIRPDYESFGRWAVSYPEERFNTQGGQQNLEVQERARMAQLNDRQKIAVNMSARAHSFLGFMETDADLSGEGVDPILYITLAAHATAHNMVAAEGAFAFFPNDHEVRHQQLPLLQATMNFLMDTCWEPAFAGAAATARVYARRSQCEATVHTLLKALKLSVADGVALTFSNRNGAEQALGRLMGGDGDVAVQAEGGAAATLISTAAKYASDFMLRVTNFEMGKHVHLLVSVYNWLHDKMAYRLSVEESLELTAWEAVGGLEEPDERDQGRRLLTDFESAWNEMQREFQSYLDCDHAQALGESVIPVVNVKQVRIGELLSQDSYDVVDLINRMLDGRLIRQQNEHLRSEHLSQLLQSEGGEDGRLLQSINRFGCLSYQLPEEMDVRFMPRDRAVMPTATIVVNKDDQAELNEYILSHTRTVTVPLPEGAIGFRTECDAVSIARFILMRYTAGRRFLRMGKLRTPFLRRSDDAEELFQGNEHGQHDQHGQHDGYHSKGGAQRKPHQHLKVAANELESSWNKSARSCHNDDYRELLQVTLQGISREESRRLDTQLAKCSEAVGSDIISYLAAALEQACSQMSEDRQHQQLNYWLLSKVSLLGVDSTVKSGEGRTLVATIKLLRIVALPAICRRIAEWWEGQEFLFSDLGRDFTQPLEEETLSSFKEITSRAMEGSEDNCNNSLEVLQALAEIMRRDDFRQSVRMFGANRCFTEIFRGELNLPPGTICEDLKTLLNSRLVETRHYAHLMRLVRHACGELSLRLRTRLSEPDGVSSEGGGIDAKSRLGYVEKVPDKLADHQEMLDFSSPVACQPSRLASQSIGGNLIDQRVGISSSSEWIVVGEEERAVTTPITIRLEPVSVAAGGGGGAGSIAAGGSTRVPGNTTRQIFLRPPAPPIVPKQTQATDQQPACLQHEGTHAPDGIDGWIEVEPPLASSSHLPQQQSPQLAVMQEIESHSAQADTSILISVPALPAPLSPAVASNQIPTAVLVSPTATVERKTIKANLSNKKLSVSTFAAQARLSEDDVKFLVQEGILPSQTLPGALGLRLLESSLAQLDTVLVSRDSVAQTLGDVPIASLRELIASLSVEDVRVLMRGSDEYITVGHLTVIQQAGQRASMSAADLADRLEVRTEDIPYLHREGIIDLLDAEGGQRLEPGSEVDVASCRAELSGVPGMAKRLLAALVAEDDVRAVQETVDLGTDQQLEEALLAFGHTGVRYQGQLRVVFKGLEALISGFDLTEEE